jgi:hypothetical protein
MWHWVIAYVWERKNPEATGFDVLRLLLICAAIFSVPAIALIIALSYAPKTPGPTRPPKDILASSPLDSARQILSRETDLDSCRAAISQLNTALSKDEKLRPASLTDSQRTELRDRFDLDGAELAEIDADNFTLLDGHYLDLCFLLRDAATSLDVEVPGADEGKHRPTPLQQAAAAFDWSVRQVRLEKSSAAPLPPQFTLRRGWGTPLERALVFLELLRHVGTTDERLTGCLIYCPDKDGNMRLWACGVLVNDKPDVYLFDPRLGLPVPGPKGEGIATLGEARTDPTVLGQLTVSDKHPYDVTPEQAATAELRYVCNLTALAPRMRLLQDELLPPAVKVHLAVNAADHVKRLPTASKAWTDGSASGAGVLRRFLPVEEGGVDAAKPGRRFFYVWGARERTGGERGIVPVSEMHPFFADQNRFPINSSLGGRIWSTFSAPFLQLALEPHHARDELLRGRYNEAIPELVRARDDCTVAENRLRQQRNLGPEIQRWIDKAVSLYADRERASAAQDPVRMEAANSGINEVWSEREAGPIKGVLAGTLAVPLRREVAFQVALCKQEQAERRQRKSELNPEDKETAQHAVDAWKEAANFWQRYLEEYSNTALAGSSAGAAARAQGRACLLTGDRDEAVRTWRREVPTSEMEKVGSLYLAKKNEK